MIGCCEAWGSVAGAALWLLLGALQGCEGGDPPEPARAPLETSLLQPPNFLFLLPDSMRADRLAARRDGQPLTPNLAALAERGVSFERATSQAGWTIPALAVLLTGRYPVQPTPEALAGGWSQAESESFPQVLSLYGYQTVAFLGAHSDMLKGALGSRFHAVVTASGDAPLAHGASQELAQWLRAEPQEPFLAFAHDVDLRFVAQVDELARWPGAQARCHKHGAKGAREKPLEIEELRACLGPDDDAAIEIVESVYDRAMADYDQGLGAVLDALDETGLAQRTVVVLTSPHGHHLGENGRFCHNTLYEPDLRIPLLWIEPMAPSPGQRVQQEVQLLDLAPSVLARAGTAPAAQMRGQSLLPLLGLAAGDYETRDVFAVNDPSNTALRSGSLKLMRLRGQRDYALYDLEQDPLESRDLMPSSAPERSAGLRERLSAFERSLAQQSRAASQRGDAGPDPELRKRLQEEGYWHNVDPEGRQGSGSRTISQ